MSLLALSAAVTAVAAAEATHVELPFPPIVYAAIAASVFVVLGFVMWSFRDAANRHSKGAGHGSDGHDHH